MEKEAIEKHNLIFKETMSNQKSKAKFLEEFTLKFAYDNVNFDEKNKLSLEFVKSVILKDNDITKREEIEIKNLSKCLKKIFEVHEKNFEITEDFVKDLHEILFENIHGAGIYRNLNVQIPGDVHQPPNYIKVYDRMKKTFLDLENIKCSFEKGIYLHLQILKIHPFLDGNGKIGRLLLVLFLLKSNILPISIPLKLKHDYFLAVEKFKVEKDINPFKKFIENNL